MGSNSNTNSMVIVAIPDENDRIWKISSDNVPHLTLLFLGDADQVANPESIVQFVEHAADRSLQRFYLPVDRRGELGADKADVLFFKQGRYDFKAIRDFRSLLLQNQNIKTAYDSTSQFEFPDHVGAAGQPWIPHLTLGYPDSPAKEIPDDQLSTIYDVSFNRVAVWMGDFDGPEFTLKDYWDEMDDINIPMDSPPLAMALTNSARKSSLSPGALLQHISEKPWSDYTKADYTPEQWHAACLIHLHEGAPTSKSECKLPVKTPNGALNRNGVHAAAAALAGARGGLKGVSDDQRNKAASALRRYYSELDEEPPESLAVHSMNLDTDLIEFLEHHGVKGQKWGVRKVEGGGDKAHIRINAKTGQATTSHATTAAIVGPAMVALPLAGLAFLHPRVRAEVKAARAVNKGIQADKKWKKQLTTAKRAVEVHNTAAGEINKKLPDFNNDSRWKGIDLNKNPAKMKEYNTAAERELLNPEYAKAAVKVHGSSPTGRYKFEIKDESTALLKLTDTTKVEHAAEDEISVQFKILRDSNGHILGFEANEEDTSMAQTVDLDAEVLDFLEHHGVKGMRWGVKKEDVSGAAKSVGSGAKKVGKGIGKGIGGAVKIAGDISFENQALDGRARNAIANEAGKEFRKTALPAIKAKPEHQQASKLKNRLLNPRDPGTKAYRKEVRETYIKQLEATANSKTNFTGDRQFTIRERGVELPAQGGKLPSSKYFWDVSTRPVRHNDDGTEELFHADTLFATMEVTLDEDGWVTNVRAVEPDEGGALAQSIDFNSVTLASILDHEELEHFGIKGMRWGVRKEGAITTQTHIDTGLLKRRTKIEVKGGHAHDAHPDAVKAAVQKQKLKKSGTDVLSTQELRDLANRLQVENQVAVLTSAKGKRVVAKQLEEEGKQALSRGARKGAQKAAPHVVKKVTKAAATGAVALAL